MQVDTKQVEEVDKCTQIQVLVQVDIKQEVDKCTQTQVLVVTSLQELLKLHKQIWAKHATFHYKIYKSKGDRNLWLQVQHHIM